MTYTGGMLLDQVVYWRHSDEVQNFGDYLTDYLLDRLFLHTARRPGEVRLIGSMLADFFVSESLAVPTLLQGQEGPRLITWGGGVRETGGLSKEARARMQILSVRGPVSASELGLGAGIPQGDPGLLLPALYTPGQDPRFLGRRVCVPHFHDSRTDAEIMAVTGCEAVLRPGIRKGRAAVEEFLDALTSCAFVLCGSLHGAIAAAAYGTPFAFWDSGRIDLPLKWRDFAESVSIPTRFIASVEEAVAHHRDEIAPRLVLPSPWPMLAVAPYPLRPAALLRIVAHESARTGGDQDAVVSSAMRAFARQDAHMSAIADESRALVTELVVASDRALTRMSHERDAAAAARVAAEAREATLQAAFEAEIAQREAALQADAAQREATLQAAFEAERAQREAALQAEAAQREATLQAAFEAERAQREAALQADAAQREATLQAAFEAERAQREAALQADAAQREAALKEEAGAALMHARQDAAELMAQIEQIRTSTAWRLTGPLRVFGRRFPGVARLGRQTLKLGWWTVSGQLTRRLRARRAVLNARAAAQAQDLTAVLNLPQRNQPAATPIMRLPVTSGPPRVSVIIPSYGQVDYTLRCLASIAAAPPTTSIEVLVVEDASGDPAVPQLEQVEGLRLIRWPANRGFLRSCNDAAKLAQGELLLFLNNDTELMPDAIDALVRLLDARPDAGMVGSRLLYPDGTLQEAGGIVWRDGSAWNYGKGDDPRKPEYSYVREVDYISGAAIMIPRARWEEMGGFDEAFLPAYCEDSDLAFRLRAAGWKVLFQPRSTVIHHEGVSHGTDTGSGIKAHQVANTRRLFERWRERLEREHYTAGERVMRARDRAADRTVTLVVDHYVPEPDRDAGSRTMMAFIDELLASGRIVKFLPANLHRTEGYADALEQRGVEVAAWPWTPSVTDWLAAHGHEIDEILLSRPSVAVDLLAPLRQHCRAPVVFYGHDLHFARMLLEPGAADSPAKRAEIARMETLERRIWRMVDMALYPSEEEVAKIRALEPQVRVRSVPPYVVRTRPVREVAPPASGGIVFIGGFRHTPNVDAAIWLAGEILPAIRRSGLDVPLTIMGSHPPSEVLALAGRGIEVRGFVPDEELAAAYARARLAICPLRYGAGVKLKVVEAMAQGVPVVTTEIGAQGLPHLATVCDIAGTTETLADAAVRLLSDDTLWLERSATQTRYVAQRFSPEAIGRSLTAAFAEAGLKSGR
jgi:GT2 family glycosyltransferase